MHPALAGPSRSAIAAVCTYTHLCSSSRCHGVAGAARECPSVSKSDWLGPRHPPRPAPPSRARVRCGSSGSTATQTARPPRGSGEGCRRHPQPPQRPPLGRTPPLARRASRGDSMATAGRRPVRRWVSSATSAPRRRGRCGPRSPPLPVRLAASRVVGPPPRRRELELCLLGITSNDPVRSGQRPYMGR